MHHCAKMSNVSWSLNTGRESIRTTSCLSVGSFSGRIFVGLVRDFSCVLYCFQLDMFALAFRLMNVHLLLGCFLIGIIE